MMTHLMDASMTEQCYGLYGTGVRVKAPAHLAQPIDHLLEHFRQTPANIVGDLSVTFCTVDSRCDIPVAVRPEAIKMASGTGAATLERPATGLPFDVWKDGDRLIVDFQHVGLLLIEPELGRATGHVIQSDVLTTNLIEYLFHTALIELLRCRGLYTIHATALEMHGLGVLIPGNSGRGKTTSFVSLLRAGYRYLSDDHPLIQDMGAHVDVLPFPMSIKVTDKTAAFFPELQAAPAEVFRPGIGKRLFAAEDVFSTRVGERCRPAIVLFPNVVDSPRSHLEVLPKSRALEVLLPQTLLVYDRIVASRQFQVLSKLVQQVDCYRLHFGRDVLDLPNVITPLLERAKR